MPPRGHAEYPPSSSDRWAGCVGSTQLIRKMYPKGVPDKQTQATASGTAIHEEAERWLERLGLPVGVAQFHVLEYNVGKKKYLIEADEWKPHVEGYLAEVKRICDELEFFTGEKPTVVVEGKVTIIDELCWGSVDVYIYAANILYVIDLKTGSGHIISAKENRQFMTYAVGICIDHKWKFDEIHLCRYQAPDEAHPFDDWLTDKVTLQAWATEMREIIKASEAGKGKLTTGEHCLWCMAKAECPEQHKTAMSVFDDEEMGTMAPVHEMTLEQQLFLVEHRKQIADYINAVADNMLQLSMNDPAAVPGFKVVEGRSMRKWNKSEAEIGMALQLEGIDSSELYEAPKLKSFTKVEKVLGKQRFAELDLIEKPPGKPTLVPISDKRTPINMLRMEGFNE